MESKPRSPKDPKDVEELIPQDKLQKVLEYILDIKFGSVTLVIHDGEIVQMEKLEKIRFK
ncbi:MAG: YezD family protein [Oscillospiraceae bacterium]|jgi:hypothetical protein|nr:YezD family protein [Oscillospiraceae bacterium]